MPSPIGQLRNRMCGIDHLATEAIAIARLCQSITRGVLQPLCGQCRAIRPKDRYTQQACDDGQVIVRFGMDGARIGQQGPGIADRRQPMPDCWRCGPLCAGISGQNPDLPENKAGADGRVDAHTFARDQQQTFWPMPPEITAHPCKPQRIQ
ncbi:hypothetical protein GGQ90_002353 [Sphingobium scionense]|uniref:Uncharacterized protein n=1 Tax=Sphingobium scionense TaxID=1404341 RepID=A0A7W6PUM8_9SPHN|nr:hypothetical protein [Sphingobium scionense]